LPAPYGAGVETVTARDEQTRATIAGQASEWFVANDEAPLGLQDSRDLVAWLKTSPLHVEEFLGVAAIARDLHAAGTDPESAVEELLARARAEDEGPIRSLWPRALTDSPDRRVRRWQYAAVPAAVLAVASVAMFLWSSRQATRPAAPADAVTLRFETRHGEQQTHRLADNSLLHLNTDSVVTVRYSETQRLVVLLSGEADFEVAHHPNRVFRVLAGRADIVDLGTIFDVRLNPDSTVVTVAEGRVAVAPAPLQGNGAAGSSQPPRVQLGANQQVSVGEGQWPVTPIAVDSQRATSWLHRQIAFEHEPLERVAAEFNRYAAKPIEITAPALRHLEVTGVFSTDDPEEFIAFLRSLEGVRVDVTATRIRVSQK
jgi:transmembrane sensor